MSDQTSGRGYECNSYEIYLGNLVDGLRKSLGEMAQFTMQEYSKLQAQLAQAEAERDALQAWRQSHNGNLAEAVDSLKAQVAIVEAERDTLKAALQYISECIDCIGPGCVYCDGNSEDDNHPPSHEASIAKRALAGNWPPSDTK